MAIKKVHIYGIGAMLLIISFDVLFFRNNGSMFLFLIGIAIGLGALPFIIGLTLENKKESKINEMFLEFSRNLAESVSAGTPISRGIINTRNKNYGVLNPYLQKLANQIELGVPVSVAMQTFAEDLNSSLVKRATSLISEAEKAGGEIEQILDSTAKSISEIEKLKKERQSAISGLIVQGYIIFFIFIGIVMVMEFRIIPLTVGVGDFGGGGFSGVQNLNYAQPSSSLSAEELTKPFIYLLLTQGFFAGLVIGKLAEGSIKKGIKHSFILMIASFLISSGARLFYNTPAT